MRSLRERIHLRVNKHQQILAHRNFLIEIGGSAERGR